MHEMLAEQFVPSEIQEVFRFFGEPANLAKLTPSWLGFQILTPPPLPMHQGALIDYEIRLGPLPMQWRTLITNHEPPHRFVDEQLVGPYSFWHHTHTFTTVEGGTLIGDHVRYVLPLGPLGRLAHKLIVRRQLETIFAYRKQIVSEIFGGA
jgi:ligand-binding SRPBCC domain-containing protein